MKLLQQDIASEPESDSSSRETPLPTQVARPPHGISESKRPGFFWLSVNVFVPLILLSLISLLVIAWGKIQPATRPPVDTTLAGRMRSLSAVRTMPLQSLTESGQKLRLNADGTVVPYREVILATEVNGRVIEKSPSCEAGKYVKAGTMLIKIDPTDYEFEVQRLRRMQEQEYNALAEVDQEMINSRRSQEISDADIELQRREVKRLESLPNDFASRGEIDQARRTLLAAEQQKVNYQNQLDLLAKRRTRLEAAERLAATQLQSAEVNLQRTTIKAPIDGVIVMENAELNTFVARGSAVVTMEDTSMVEVAAKLRSDQLYWVLNQDRTELGDSTHSTTSDEIRSYRLPQTPVRVMFQVAGRDDVRYVWQGTLVGYDGIGMDEQTRTVPVRVLVREPRKFSIERIDGNDLESEERVAGGPSALIRGMYVNLQLELDSVSNLVVIPAEALRPGNRVWEFVANDDVLKLPTVVAPEKETVDAPEPWYVVAQRKIESWFRSSENASTQQAPVEDDGFDPSQWTAGQLRVRDSIRPVDWIATDGSLSGGEESAEDRAIDERVMVGGKLWICEFPPGALKSDSRVVVSPLGNVNSDGLPVRTKSK